MESSLGFCTWSPSRDYSRTDNQTTQTTETPGFKPFTVLNKFSVLNLVLSGVKGFMNNHQNLFTIFENPQFGH